MVSLKMFVRIFQLVGLIGIATVVVWGAYDISRRIVATKYVHRYVSLVLDKDVYRPGDVLTTTSQILRYAPEYCRMKIARYIMTREKGFVVWSQIATALVPNDTGGKPVQVIRTFNLPNTIPDGEYVFLSEAITSGCDIGAYNHVESAKVPFSVRSGK